MNPLISVIIPVYKVEAYLHQCVESVLNQIYQNLEIILVDDGSPDNCPTICDEFTYKDNRVKVIHKKNGGASDARNFGLKASNGEYILFLDSDDYWVDTNLVNKLIETVNKNKRVDIIFFGRLTFYENNPTKIIKDKEFDLKKIDNKSKTEVLSYFIGDGRFIISAYQRLIRKSILIENAIFFEKGLVGEDIDWNFKLMLSAKHFFAINNLYYAYRVREGSVTATFGYKNAKDLLHIITKWANYFSLNNIDGRQKYLLLGYCAYQYGILMGAVKSLKKKMEREEIEKGMSSLTWLLEYNVNYKTNQVSKLYKMFGFNITSHILNFYIYLNKKGFRY